MRAHFAAISRLATCSSMLLLPSLASAQDAPEAAPAASNQPVAAPVTLVGENIVQITLEDAVQLALANNFGLRLESYNLNTAREAVGIAHAAFEPVIAASVDTSKSQSAYQTSTTQTRSSESASGSASISQRVDTGGTVTLQTNLGRTDQSGGDAAVNSFYSSGVSLSVRQPILAGAGFKVNRLSRERARIGVERSEASFRGQALDVVRDTELAFYNLASAHFSLDVQRSGLVSAEKFLAETEARRAAGLATELDVMQARVSVANRRSQIVSAEQRVRDTTDSVLVLFGRRDFSGILQPVGFVFAPPAEPSVERSYGLAVANDPSLENARGQLRQLELDVVSAQNSKLPTLNLSGSVTYSGSDPEFGGAYSSLADRDNYRWSAGLSLNMPWGMNEARARLRNAQNSLEQQKVRLEQLEQTTMVSIRSAVRSLQSDMQTVEINALSTELSKREFELEKAKFDNGLSTSRLVVEAQQRWDEAKVREIQSRVQLRQDAARLRRLEGASLDLYGVESLSK